MRSWLIWARCVSRRQGHLYTRTSMMNLLGRAKNVQKGVVGDLWENVEQGPQVNVPGARKRIFGHVCPSKIQISLCSLIRIFTIRILDRRECKTFSYSIYKFCFSEVIKFCLCQIVNVGSTTIEVIKFLIYHTLR